MIKRDLHTHTVFCDGKNTPEEMVLSAIGRGLDCLGICVHSYVAFDEGACIAKSRYPEFQGEIARLKDKYAGKIELKCGIEQDFYSETGTEGFDYVIGSVHYIKVGGTYLSVDNTAEIFKRDCCGFFNGDYYAYAGRYYETVSQVADKTGCDIIGHFDLVTKFNEGETLFGESEPRYVKAYKAAVDALIPCGKPFEVNTGAISRGYRSAPYPAKPIADYIAEKGGELILSSDAHSADAIAFGFDEWEGLTVGR